MTQAILIETYGAGVLGIAIALADCGEDRDAWAATCTARRPDVDTTGAATLDELCARVHASLGRPVVVAAVDVDVVGLGLVERVADERIR